ncbi:response regulator [Spongiibacter sp. KMU-158]|uniref:histidine kinase n=1 Tax=Spongiibacter pelagi TaxID=2760804 RepID=A0A927C250_9GAMM|nr:response regulator [Spongiibacter pelagi]MBD2858637.1 response regulator [Spongiibacter pelagi]
MPHISSGGMKRAGSARAQRNHSSILWLWFCLLSVLCIYSNTSLAHGVDLSDTNSYDTLQHNLTVYSRGADIDWPEISAPENQPYFHLLKTGDLLLSEAMPRYWLSFEISNESEDLAQAFLSLEPNTLDDVRLFCGGKEITPVQPLKWSRDGHLFNLRLHEDGHQTCFLQVGDKNSHYLVADILSSDDLLSKIGQELVKDAAILCALLIIMLYNIFALFYYGDKLFAGLAVHSLLIITSVAFALGYIGIPQGLLPPWPNASMAFLIAGIFIIPNLYLRFFPIYPSYLAGFWNPVTSGLIIFNLVAATIYTITEGKYGLGLMILVVVLNPFAQLICTLQSFWQQYQPLLLGYLLLRLAVTLLVVQAIIAQMTQSFEPELIFYWLIFSLILSQYLHSGLLVLRNHEKVRQQVQTSSRLHAANEVNRAKSEMLTRLTHDIRTPLSAILGVSEMLGESRLSLTQRRYIETLQQSSHELLGILDESSQAYQPHEQDEEPVTELFKLEDLLANLMDSFRNMAAERQLELAVDIDPELPAQYVGDPTRIKQLLSHAINSAFEHRQEGMILLSISRPSPMRRHLAFTVSHKGRPFSEQEKLAAQRQWAEDGSSMINNRFAIMAQLCQLLDGQINLSTNNQNLHQVSLLVAAEIALVDSRPIEKMDSLQGKAVLLVDDNPILLDLLSRQCQSWEMDILAAQSIPEAIAQLRNRQLLGKSIDIVLLDSKLPNSGLDLAQQIWEEHIQKNLTPPIQMLLAFANLQLSRDELQSAHISRVLSKPISSPALRSAMLSELHYSNIQTPLNPTGYRTASLPDRQLHCLIAEDNPANALVLSKMLESLGIIVTQVENGQLALDRFYRHHFDAVILDIEMPVLNGIEACKQMRAFERESGSRDRAAILGLTANPLEDYAEAFLNIGMDMHLNKPIRLWELEEALRRWVNLDTPQAPLTED